MKIITFLSLAFIVVVLWTAYLFCWPHMNSGALFNPNPGKNVVVGMWQPTTYGYETRTIVDHQFFYTINGDQKRYPNLQVVGDTTRLNYSLNEKSVIVVISGSLVGLLILQYFFFKLFPVNIGGRGFTVET